MQTRLFHTSGGCPTLGFVNFLHSWDFVIFMFLCPLSIYQFHNVLSFRPYIRLNWLSHLGECLLTLLCFLVLWQGKPERVPWCSSVHHSKFLIGLNPRVIHLWGFLRLIQVFLHLIQGFLHVIRGLGPLIGLFHSFLRMVHWCLSLCSGNLYLQYQNFPISIHFQIFLIFNFI